MSTWIAACRSRLAVVVQASPCGPHFRYSAHLPHPHPHPRPQAPAVRLDFSFDPFLMDRGGAHVRQGPGRRAKDSHCSKSPMLAQVPTNVPSRGERPFQSGRAFDHRTFAREPDVGVGGCPLGAPPFMRSSSRRSSSPSPSSCSPSLPRRPRHPPRPCPCRVAVAAPEPPSRSAARTPGRAAAGSPA